MLVLSCVLAVHELEELAQEAHQHCQREPSIDVYVQDLRLGGISSNEVADHCTRCRCVGGCRCGPGVRSQIYGGAVGATRLHHLLGVQPLLKLLDRGLALVFPRQDTVVDEGQHRVGLHLRLLAHVLAACAVHLRDPHRPISRNCLVRQLLPYRCQPLAMSAPRSVELDEPRTALDVILEVELREFDNVVLLRSNASDGDGCQHGNQGDVAARHPGPGHPHRPRLVLVGRRLMAVGP
mmetsp:Transcript_72670/g.162696  ORF Transcript_72670/g.162696 Transcript_72670/m.162696 type:complete len:237 (+) Transcript_72670:221-931(+)